MSLINFFWLIERLYIVQLSQHLQKYLECSDRLFYLLSHHQVIVIHIPLPQVWVIPPGRALMLIRWLYQAPLDLRTLYSPHRILIQRIVVPILARLFSDQSRREGGELPIYLLPEHLLLLVVLLTVLVEFLEGTRAHWFILVVVHFNLGQLNFKLLTSEVFNFVLGTIEMVLLRFKKFLEGTFGVAFWGIDLRAESTFTKLTSFVGQLGVNGSENWSCHRFTCFSKRIRCLILVFISSYLRSVSLALSSLWRFLYVIFLR